MKKRHFVLAIILILIGLFIAFSAAAHPYDDPLTFRKHLTDDGRVIYSNIPKKCFSNGYLTCQQLHPIYGMPVSTKMAESKSSSQIKPKEKVSAPGKSKDVKMSVNNICHKTGDRDYEDTETVIGWFYTTDDCEAAGGRLPKVK